MKVKIGDKEYEVPDAVGKAFKDMGKKVTDMTDQVGKYSSTMADMIDQMEKGKAKDKKIAPGPGEDKEPKQDPGMHNKDKEGFMGMMKEKDEKIKALQDQIKQMKNKDKEKKDQSQEILSFNERSDALALAKRILKDADFKAASQDPTSKIKDAIVRAQTPEKLHKKLDNIEYLDAKYDIILNSYQQADEAKDRLSNNILQMKKKESKNDDKDVVFDAATARALSIRESQDYVVKKMAELNKETN